MGSRTVAEAIEVIKNNYAGCLSKSIARALMETKEAQSDCDYMVSCEECRGKQLGILADMAEREKAEAVSAAMERTMAEHMREWALDNDLPAFHEGEDFGQWLNRCFLPRPLFENGEPVQQSDMREIGSLATCCVYTDGSWTFDPDKSDDERNPKPWDAQQGSRSDRIKRPAPKVLDANGVPIEVGDTVYDIESGDRYTVKIPYAGTGKTFFDDGHYSDPAYLTHTPPDAQWRIDKDVSKSYRNYWGCEELPCGACPTIVGGRKPWQRYGVYNCDDAKTLDLLRRQRELDTRKGGAE